MEEVESLEKKTDVNMPPKEREYLFDNLKAVLIFLVVLCHFKVFNASIYRTILTAISIVHMPLFIFTTGYFTKYDIKNTEKAIKNYLIPYVIFSLLLYLFSTIILKENFTFKLLEPQFAMWFLLTVFIYKITYNGICKIKGLFVISIIISIIVGFDTSFTTNMSMQRTFSFFPFFIAGTKFKKEYLWKYDFKKSRYILLFLVIALLLVFCYVTETLKIPLRSGIYYNPYALQGTNVCQAMIYRIFNTISSFVFCYLILNLMPREKTIISHIGQNTITVFLLHILVVKTFDVFDVFKESNLITFITAVILSMLIVYITSRPIIKKCYDYIFNKICSIIGI